MISPSLLCYKRLRAFGDQYGCYLSRYVKSSNVLVMYASAGERVFPGQVMRFIQFESSVPLCNSQVEQLAARPTAGAPPEERQAIQDACDFMARNRVTCVHTMAEMRWYKTANKRVSQTGPLEETPIQLVS